MAPIRLGDTVKDRVTAFEGVALIKQTALYDGTKFLVQPMTLIGGVPASAAWLEEGRLEVLDAAPATAGFGTVR